MPKDKRMSECGKSAAETLSGFALFGVLIIGGVSGYGYAMRLYQEAETLDQLSVLIAGGRSYDIPLHLGERTFVEDDQYEPYIVPIRDVVSRVNYRSKITALDAGLIDEEGYLLDSTMKDVREYEAFDTPLNTPVWVRAEDENNWSVRITGLSYSLCEKLLRKSDLGFDYAYVALRDTYDNMPKDPELSDFSEVYKEERYANPSRKASAGISTDEQISKVCSALDATKGNISLAQRYIQHIDDSEETGIAYGTSDTVCKNKKSVACLASGARIYNPKTKKVDLPLQTLVLHFGSGEREAVYQ